MKMIHPKTVRKRIDFRPAKGRRFDPLEETLAMRELYIRGIKHDINGLLAPIMSTSEYFASFDEEKSGKMAPAMKRFHMQTKATLEQVTKLTALLANLQMRAPVSILFDPADEIARAVLCLTYELGKAKIETKVKHTHKLQGNPLELYRAFMNLLINAHHAIGPEGRISVLSRDRSISRKPYVSVSVEDNGIGMDKRAMDEVFQPGVTYKECGEGLGLFVVQHSVASFGGILDAESAPGVGTKFTLNLPAGN